MSDEHHKEHSQGGGEGAARGTGGVLWIAGWLFAAASGGVLWSGGWLFTIGFLNLAWWKVILGLVVWPYFLGTWLK